jgi:tripartite-type tricarboxylate transporter receptor subunit TctC
MQVLKFKSWTAVFAVLIMSVCSTSYAVADTWPSKPIKLIVPFPAGGPTDSLARQIATQLSTSLGQPIIIENVGGANGSIGMGQVAKAKPDGYTLGLGSSGSQVINPLLYSKLANNPTTDLAPISMVAEYVNVLVVNNDLPVHNVPELIAYAKANPGKVNYGSAGNGSSNHLGGFDFGRLTGISATHVPYKGSAPALVDLMAGNTTFMFDIMVTSMPQVRAGKLRALATSGTVRNKQVLNLPTVAETVPGFSSVGWFALYGPAELRLDVAQRLSQEIAKLARFTEFVDILSKQGFDLVGSTPEQLRDRSDKEMKLLEPIVKASGAKVD